MNMEQLDLRNVVFPKLVLAKAFNKLKKYIKQQYRQIMWSKDNPDMKIAYMIIDLEIIKNKHLIPHADLNLLSSAFFLRQFNILNFFDKKTFEHIKKMIDVFVRYFWTQTHLEFIKQYKNKNISIKINTLYPEHLFYLGRYVMHIDCEFFDIQVTDEMLAYSTIKVNKPCSKPIESHLESIDFNHKCHFYFKHHYPFKKPFYPSCYVGLGPINLETIMTMKQNLLTIDELKEILFDIKETFSGTLMIKLPDVTRLFFGSPFVDHYASAFYNTHKEKYLFSHITEAVNQLNLSKDVIYVMPTLKHLKKYENHVLSEVIKSFYIDQELYQMDQIMFKNIHHSYLDLRQIIEECGDDDMSLKIDSQDVLRDIHSKLRIARIKHLICNLEGISESDFNKLLNMGFRELELTDQSYEKFYQTIKCFKERRQLEFKKTF